MVKLQKTVDTLASHMQKLEEQISFLAASKMPFPKMTSSPSGLIICTWNANSIPTKIDKLRHFVDKHKPDVILVQETKLPPF